MKNTWSYWVDSTSGNNGYYYQFRNFGIWKAYKEYGFEQVRKWDMEQSFTGKFIHNGFEQVYPERKIHPTINWHGVSIYHPDLLLKKGDKEIRMSLQGLTMAWNQDVMKKYSELLNKGACKYICLSHGKETIYETYTGELPSKELTNKFLS